MGVVLMSPRPARMSVGVAVLGRGDGCALDIGLRSLARQSAAIDETVIVRQPASRRLVPAPATPSPAAAETIDVRWSDGRNAALDRLAARDIVLIAPEGATLDPDAVADVVARFEAAPRLVAAMLTSRRVLPHRRLPPHAAALDPERLTACFARSRSRGASRYFAPTIIALAPGRGRLPRFETFASRSDWASGRLFLDAAAAVGEVAEVETGSFAFIGGAPDRRGGFGQGEQCYDALLRLATAYPGYRAFAAADARRLLLEQLVALALEPDRKSTRAFLAGMRSRFVEDLALRRRLKRDIRHLG